MPRFSDAKKAKIRRKYNNRCAQCGNGGQRLTIDHVVPLADGGSNDISNLQLLCGPCNQRKGSKHSTRFQIQPKARRVKTLKYRT